MKINPQIESEEFLRVDRSEFLLSSVLHHPGHRLRVVTPARRLNSLLARSDEHSQTCRSSPEQDVHQLGVTVSSRCQALGHRLSSFLEMIKLLKIQFCLKKKKFFVIKRLP